MPYKVIFIDWDGTLSPSRFWGHWALDKKRVQDYASIQKILFQDSPEIARKWLLGDITSEEVVELMSKKTQLTRDDLFSNLQKSCQNMKFFDPSILEVVEKLRQKGIKVVIATDNMDTLNRWTIPALQLTTHFDAILNSHDIKALKREKAEDGSSLFFTPYLNTQKIIPSQTLLIDDSPNNVVVKDFGMNYTQVTSETSALSILLLL